MEFRQIGNSDLRVSICGLGCNNLGFIIDESQSKSVIQAARDCGINFFDTAERYGFGRSEEILGQALAHDRQDVVIATKFGNPREPTGSPGSRAEILRSVEGSLRHLGTDYIDLYQMHAPDPSTPLDETLEVLSELVDSGKVRYIGTSNFTAALLAEAAEVSASHEFQRFITAQNEWNLLRREVESGVVPACQELGIGLLPYQPLRSGLLTGKYESGIPFPSGTRLAHDERFAVVATEDGFETVRRLRAYADLVGRTPADLALGWLASRSVVPSVIVGATTVEQVQQNAASTMRLLTDSDLAEIDRITR